MKNLILLSLLIIAQLCMGCVLAPYRAYPEHVHYWGPYHDHYAFNERPPQAAIERLSDWRGPSLESARPKAGAI